MSATRFLIGLCALAVGCAGRALPQQGASAPPARVHTVQAQGAPAAQQAAPQGTPPLAEYGAHGAHAFPEIRGSSGAVAAYSVPEPDVFDDPSASPDTAPAPAPRIVEIPEGVSALPPFDAPAPSRVPAPPFHPPRSSSTRSVYQPLPPPRVTVGLPGGEVCLKKLALMGVAFQPLEEIRGIETPIQIQGPIGGIRYHSGFGPMVSDCRFALALATAAPQLFALGVSEMRFSGAYSYRTSRVGRLSLHAYGLALDVHEIVVEGRRLSVEKDFARGIGCGVGPALNRVACRLRELGVFRELLTPDYNADHNNHFHLGVAPLGPLANELWVKRPARHPSPRLPEFGNGSRSIAASSDDGDAASGKPAKSQRDAGQKSPAKTRAKPADPETPDERRAEKRRGAAATESKAKRERASREDASARGSKPVTKARKRKRPVADKPSKQSRVKAAKRNSSRDKDGNS